MKIEFPKAMYNMKQRDYAMNMELIPGIFSK